MGKDVAVLDIGSRKLVFAVGRKTLNGVTSIISFSENIYDGYYEGEFCNVDALFNDVSNLIKNANVNKMPKCLYISVPSEFTKIETNTYLENLGKEKLISNSLIDSLHEKGDRYAVSYDYELISSAGLEYVLDGRKYYSSPVGERAQFIKATISYILVKKSFLKLFSNIAKELGFKNVEFISSQFALGSRFIDESARAYGSISLDVGFGSTSIAVLLGEGISSLSSAPLGAASIFANLAEITKVDFNSALSIQNDINLNYANDETKLYKIIDDNKIKTFKAYEINKAIFNQLDLFVEFIENTLKKSSVVSETTPIYMTGGGVYGIKGAIMYLEHKLKRRIRLIALEIPNYNKPYYTSIFSLIDVAHEIYENSSIWNKLF